MQPLVRELQRKHKGNRQKIAEETMALYREHGVNQSAAACRSSSSCRSCLPCTRR